MNKMDERCKRTKKAKSAMGMGPFNGSLNNYKKGLGPKAFWCHWVSPTCNIAVAEESLVKERTVSECDRLTMFNALKVKEK